MLPAQVVALCVVTHSAMLACLYSNETGMILVISGFFGLFHYFLKTKRFGLFPTKEDLLENEAISFFICEW